MASSFGNQASKHSGAAFSMGKSSSKPKAKKLQDEGPGYYEREGAFGAQASSTRSSTPRGLVWRRRHAYEEQGQAG